MIRPCAGGLLLSALAFTACGGGSTATAPLATTASTPSTTTVSTPPDSTTAETTTTATTLPPNVDAGVVGPRSVTYAHVAFTVIGAEYSNATPGTYLEDEPDVSEDRYLYLNFSAEFEQGYPGRLQEFEVADFTLRLADGTLLRADQVDFRGRILVTDEGPYVSALAFAGDGLSLAGSVLAFDNEVNEPMAIPLDGPAPADPYPIVVGVGASGDADFEGGCAEAPGTVTVVEAEWDVDAGVDHDGEPIASNARRSTLGERFVRTRVQVVAGSGNCGGTVMTTALFRLVSDGLPLGPENSFARALKDGEGAEIVWAFRVPVDTSDLVLEVGLSGERIASFPLEVPTELP